VGDHACEYMTGGRVVVLGKTGRNFAAGMSGGVAYIYDAQGDFRERCNLSMVELEKLKSEDETILNELLNKHWQYTGSAAARKALDNFKHELKHFIKVMPTEYKRILEHKKMKEKADLSEVSD
ncbi:MAG: hypothetical protein NT060_00205, partial [Candidatus Omnitrophica bacterium]|nr:hypothetical protein [Candidatus Omnitrophota bacterium]